MPELNPDDFINRYVTCPLCQRSNVRLRYYRANIRGMHVVPQPVAQVIIDEHPMAVDVVAHPSPITNINPDLLLRARAAEAGFNPLPTTAATYARVRCPASLAPLLPMEGA